ncbi:MAG TPA: DUF3987 domain-containing protein [Gemmataceae bacterium]|nr:DUF3987 domain-containing protein [Gemmataceae bacterium]
MNANGKPAGCPAPRSAKKWEPARPPQAPAARARVIPDYQRFPVHTLPPVLAAFVTETAAAVGCDEANAALPVLAAAAAAIGNTRQIRLKRQWTEPAVVWAALVGSSGYRKSPPFRMAMRPLFAAEAEFREEHKEALRQYAAADDDEAEPPVMRRVLTEDATIEALAPILVDNPRGVINARDEIDDWFQALTRYKGRNGGTDRGRWLKLSSADTLTVDRKTGEPHLRRVFIPIASCSISGTIQPGILQNSLDRLARASGLAARLLLAMPAAQKAYWSELEVGPETEAAYADLIRRLLDLRMGEDDKGRPAPVILNLTPAAKAVWVPFYDRIQDQKADAEADIAAVLAKLEGYGARFGLIYHVAEEVAAGRDGTAPVSDRAIRAGIGLADWFAHEARRIYMALGEDDETRDERELVQWVKTRGGRCTARTLQHARGGTYPTAGAAEAALEALAEKGYGTWETEANPRGGWAKQTFVLNIENDTDTCDTRPGDGGAAGGCASDTRSDTRPGTPSNPAGFRPSVASVGAQIKECGRGDGPDEGGDGRPVGGASVGECTSPATDLPGRGRPGDLNPPTIETASDTCDTRPVRGGRGIGGPNGARSDTRTGALSNPAGFRSSVASVGVVFNEDAASPASGSGRGGPEAGESSVGAGTGSAAGDASAARTAGVSGKQIENRSDACDTRPDPGGFGGSAGPSVGGVEEPDDRPDPLDREGTL